MSRRALAPVLLAAAAALVGTAAGGTTESTVILAEHLNHPTAVAFNPHDGTLWIVNYADDSSVVVHNPGTSLQSAKRYTDDSDHFLNNPTQIAFSWKFNEFASSQDNRNDYNGKVHHGNDFMGPTLWTAELARYEGGDRSHKDMLHHSLLGMGIAVGRNGTNREYWVFNGLDGCIDRYFFNQPHVLGGDDHRDGRTYRYARGGVKRLADVPSHLALDRGSGLLYIADTGNRRIGVLDTKVSTRKFRRLLGRANETPLRWVPGVRVRTFAQGFDKPSGLALWGDRLLVGDHATGVVSFLRLADGRVERTLDTGVGAGALTGITVGPDGKLYALDAKGNRLLRFDL